MGFFFKRNGNPDDSICVTDSTIMETKAYDLAINSATDIIALLISKCEFNIYKNGKKQIMFLHIKK